jgi:hypothetical protein
MKGRDGKKQQKYMLEEKERTRIRNSRNICLSDSSIIGLIRRQKVTLGLIN